MSIGGPLPTTPSTNEDTRASGWQQVTIEADQNDGQRPAASPDGAKVATLTTDGEAAGEPGAPSAAGQSGTISVEAIPEPDPKFSDKPRSSRSHHGSDERRAAYYDSPGRRHFQPRPGTMRYNLLSTLGGIY